MGVVITIIIVIGLLVIVSKMSKKKDEEMEKFDKKLREELKEKNKESSRDEHSEYIADIRDGFKSAIEKFKSRCAPQVARLAQLHPNPNKQQAILELGNAGQFGEIFSRELIGINDELKNILMMIFAYACYRTNIDVDEFRDKQEKLFAELREIEFDIKREFAEHDLLQYNDNQLNEFIIRLTKKLELKLRNIL